MKRLVCFVGTTAAKFVVYKRRFVCWSFPWDNSSSRYKAEVGKRKLLSTMRSNRDFNAIIFSDEIEIKCSLAGGLNCDC